MVDPRQTRVARTIIHHSTRLQPGEAILIDAYDVHDGLVNAIVDEAYAAGGLPLVQLRSAAIMRQHLLAGSEPQIRLSAEIELFQMQRVQAYVGLRAWENSSELSDVPPEHVARNLRWFQKPVHTDCRLSKKWVILRYPTPSMAQMANMSTEAFEKFYYDVCTVDYARMSDAIAPLAGRMQHTDRVRITGPGTDLSFSIAGIGAMSCEGRRNLPDGECFSSPVRDSVNGTIAYNTPSLYHGTTYTHVRLTFEGGRVVRADGEPHDKLQHILSLDEGASYVGEFSLGFNPHVLHPIKDTLFDEKIAGSLHFTPGQALDYADNGNRSQIHWDLVLIQRPEYGGGEVWFDGECIRRDGRFIAPELEGLNPERLLAAG